MPNLALFDFDGTVTSVDTFTAFVFHAVGKRRMFFGKIALSPLIALYKCGWYPATKLRANITMLGFAGRPTNDVWRIGTAFGGKEVASVVRPDAWERIQWHKAQGDVVVIVSASLEVYLTSWCTANAVDLICTRLESKDGRLTGRYAGGDCTGREKARRVRAKYDVSAFPVVYAYGDTHEDEEMLSLASERFFRSFERDARVPDVRNASR